MHDDGSQVEQYGPPCVLCSGFNHSPKHCFKGEHDINNLMQKMSLALAISIRMVYINNGEHDNPHELPKENLEGSLDTSILTIHIQIFHLNYQNR